MSVVVNFNKRTKFQLKSIRVYGSDEWMAGATKKYRSVYDRFELQWIRCELALHNLEFKGEPWTLNTVCKCFDITGGLRKEICSLDNSTTVNPEEDIVYVRDGWGSNGIGEFWREGSYCWEVYVEGEKIGEAPFKVNEVGRVSRTGNPYFRITGINFYAGDFDGWQQQNKTFLEVFKGPKTEYVWAEVSIENRTDRPWAYELFFNFYDSARQLKGQIIRTGRVETNRRNYQYTFDAGWGNKTPGSFKDELYYFDVVFMDKLIGTASFEIGTLDKPGTKGFDLIID